MYLLFHRFQRQILFLLLFFLGLACAHLAMTLLKVNLRVDLYDIPDLSASGVEVSQDNLQEALDFILQQDLFDPENRGVAKTNAPETSMPQSSEPKKTRKDLVLLGTLVAGVDSLAVVRQSTQTDFYRLGAELADGSRIEQIERNRVVLRNRDQTQSVLVFAEEKKEMTSVPERSPSKSGIVNVGPGQWKIARGVAEEVRENIAQELRLALMEPRIVDGKTHGFVIRQLSAKSMLVPMGLRRGDVVLNVNNMALNSPENALQILQQLREARNMSVDIERNRQKMTFNYELE